MPLRSRNFRRHGGRFVSGRSKLKPAVADAIFASRILITLTVARSSGVPISWELSKWGRASHLLELSAYCDEQAQPSVVLLLNKPTPYVRRRSNTGQRLFPHLISRPTPSDIRL